MTHISSDVLLAIRALMQSAECGAHWTLEPGFFTGRKYQARDFFLLSEVGSESPGCYYFDAVDRSGPLTRLDLGTGSRLAWNTVAPELVRICDQFGVGWWSHRSWRNPIGAPFWEFVISDSRGEWQPSSLITVCQSADNRMVFPDPFAEALEIDPKFENGLWCETKGGFQFTCYRQKVVEGLRARYADCQTCVVTAGRKPNQSYTLDVVFPDMINNMK